MRQRRLPTRKKRAIRQIAIAIAALLLVNHILDVGLLLPVQAVWKVKESMCMDPMRVVARDHAPELGNTELTYLLTNENAMVITSVQLTALGWQCPGGAMLVEFDHRERAAVWNRLVYQGGPRTAGELLFWLGGRPAHLYGNGARHI